MAGIDGATCGVVAITFGGIVAGAGVVLGAVVVGGMVDGDMGVVVSGALVGGAVAAAVGGGAGDLDVCAFPPDPHAASAMAEAATAVTMRVGFERMHTLTTGRRGGIGPPVGASGR